MAADASLDVLASAFSTQPVVFAHLRLCAPWRLAIPPADHAGFHVVERGPCWLEPGEGSPPLALAEGDLVLVPHGAAHTLADAPASTARPMQIEALSSAANGCGAAMDGPATVLVCGGYLFGGRGPAPLRRRLPPFIHVDRERASQESRSALSLLLAELQGGRSGSRTVVNRLADVLLVHVLRDWLRGGAGPDGDRVEALADEPVGRALALIHDDPGAGWTVDRLAASVTVSRATFVRRFRALTGESPRPFLARARMEEAARLLRGTPAPVAEVGAHVGYASEYAFSRAFHRYHGTSPGRYRRRDGSGQPPEPQGLLTINSQPPSA